MDARAALSLLKAKIPNQQQTNAKPQSYHDKPTLPRRPATAPTQNDDYRTSHQHQHHHRPPARAPPPLDHSVARVTAWSFNATPSKQKQAAPPTPPECTRDSGCRCAACTKDYKTSPAPRSLLSSATAWAHTTPSRGAPLADRSKRAALAAASIAAVDAETASLPRRCAPAMATAGERSALRCRLERHFDSAAMAEPPQPPPNAAASKGVTDSLADLDLSEEDPLAQEEDSLALLRSEVELAVERRRLVNAECLRELGVPPPNVFESLELRPGEASSLEEASSRDRPNVPPPPPIAPDVAPELSPPPSSAVLDVASETAVSALADDEPVLGATPHCGSDAASSLSSPEILSIDELLGAPSSLSEFQVSAPPPPRLPAVEELPAAGSTTDSLTQAAASWQHLAVKAESPADSTTSPLTLLAGSVPPLVESSTPEATVTPAPTYSQEKLPPIEPSALATSSKISSTRARGAAARRAMAAAQRLEVEQLISASSSSDAPKSSGAHPQRDYYISLALSVASILYDAAATAVDTADERASHRAAAPSATIESVAMLSRSSPPQLQQGPVATRVKPRRAGPVFAAVARLGRSSRKQAPASAETLPGNAADAPWFVKRDDSSEAAPASDAASRKKSGWRSVRRTKSATPLQDGRVAF